MKLPGSASIQLDARGFRFAIVAARFNETITGRLVEGATSAFQRCGAQTEDVPVYWVPGAFELPLAAHELARSGRFQAVVALGCVIRGETPHFDYVAGEAARGIMEAGLATGVPISFGVITAETLQQAEDRAGGKHGNKGEDAALAAIEMASFIAAL
jgi:6,7-dimethyl-8-ribityllumazine synthase